MLFSDFKKYLNGRLNEAKTDLLGCSNPTKKIFWEALIMNFEFIIKNANKIEYPNCKSCRYFNIKSDEHGICDNPKNEFPLRFNASKKGYKMLKSEVKLNEFEAEIKPYTTFYIHQDFGCVNHCA